MVDDTAQQTPSLITDMSAQTFMKVVIAGLAVGAIAGGLTLLLSMYIFKVTPCYAETCGVGGQYAAILAGIVSAAAALFWLIRLQVFRPLLIVIAVTIGLWGVSLYIFDWPWYHVILVSAGLHAIAYGAFAWFSRIRVFWLVAFLLIVIIVGLRFILLTS